MKITNANSMKRNMVSILLIAAAIMPAPAIGAALTVSLITQELVNFNSPNCLSGIEGNTTGTGYSSLLGGTSLKANDCIIPQQDDFSFAGKITLTMSNGDALFADYSGLLSPTSYLPIYTFTNSSFTIMGGTGSFSKASGSGTLQGGENIQTGLGLMYAAGTLSNYKKDKDKKDKDNPSSRQTLSLVSSSLSSSEPHTTTIANLDSSFHPNRLTLGQYFFQDQSPQALAENPLPESASLGLVGIGLVSLAVIRRRKLSNSIRRNL